MAITSATIVPLTPGVWRLEFASDDPAPTFYIYRDGQRVHSTSATHWQTEIGPDEYPVFEILDTDDPPSRAYPGHFEIGWYADATVESYLVQEYVSGVWTDRQTIQNEGQGYLRFRSRFLEDVTTHQFRIVPLGTNQNQGTNISFAGLMVRHPDPPAVTFAYSSSTAKVTIDAI